MAIKTLEATLTSEAPTPLFTARFGRCRLTVTGIAGEFTTVSFQIKRGRVTAPPFEAREVFIGFIQTFPEATILATAPEGVGALDITYEVRTRGDA